MKYLKRLLLSLFIALPVLGVLLIVTPFGARADTATATPAPDPSDCNACHQEFETAWLNGRHAKASSSETFVQSWTSQGKPTACLACHAPGYDPESGAGMDSGVTCVACHGPVLPDHPTQAMQVDTSGQLCVKCHSQPIPEGVQMSGAHDQTGMPCTTCHDPHTNSFQAPPGSPPGVLQNPSALCENCHKDVAVTAQHSIHGAANVGCVDCHMGVKVTDGTNPHAAPDHTANATLNACVACHSKEMHASAPTAAATEAPASATPGTLGAGFLSSAPSPASPLGYTVISLLIGLACGFALAPLFERASRRRRGGK